MDELVAQILVDGLAEAARQAADPFFPKTQDIQLADSIFEISMQLVEFNKTFRRLAYALEEMAGVDHD